ncbi:hypothetical protein H696_05714 [Fonticula alba]|uniref:Uncharacterized protein n=1 Tax=Fonticula alba TaxID=691883 RepID=A0A058Z0V6_FONAL|nr:hypothetical protein H696_05714 [Fonticula alba]KCV67771.1 hypothetical protein H696_05714 [Fonticula alba]|eukprot:XP_009497802.1 hypothetical protein H696_05714 [Fonticula alba]
MSRVRGQNDARAAAPGIPPPLASRTPPDSRNGIIIGLRDSSTDGINSSSQLTYNEALGAAAAAATVNSQVTMAGSQTTQATAAAAGIVNALVEAAAPPQVIAAAAAAAAAALAGAGRTDSESILAAALVSAASSFLDQDRNVDAGIATLSAARRSGDFYAQLLSRTAGSTSDNGLGYELLLLAQESVALSIAGGGARGSASGPRQPDPAAGAPDDRRGARRRRPRQGPRPGRAESPPPRPVAGLHRAGRTASSRSLASTESGRSGGGSVAAGPASPAGGVGPGPATPPGGPATSGTSPGAPPPAPAAGGPLSRAWDSVPVGPSTLRKTMRVSYSSGDCRRDHIDFRVGRIGPGAFEGRSMSPLGPGPGPGPGPGGSPGPAPGAGPAFPPAGGRPPAGEHLQLLERCQSDPSACLARHPGPGMADGADSPDGLDDRRGTGRDKPPGRLARADSGSRWSVDSAPGAGGHSGPGSLAAIADQVALPRLLSRLAAARSPDTASDAGPPTPLSGDNLLFTLGSDDGADTSDPEAGWSGDEAHPGGYSSEPGDLGDWDTASDTEDMEPDEAPGPGADLFGGATPGAPAPGPHAHPPLQPAAPQLSMSPSRLEALLRDPEAAGDPNLGLAMAAAAHLAVPLRRSQLETLAGRTDVAPLAGHAVYLDHPTDEEDMLLGTGDSTGAGVVAGAGAAAAGAGAGTAAGTAAAGPGAAVDAGGAGPAPAGASSRWSRVVGSGKVRPLVRPAGAPGSPAPGPRAAPPPATPPGAEADDEQDAEDPAEGPAGRPADRLPQRAHSGGHVVGLVPGAGAGAGAGGGRGGPDHPQPATAQQHAQAQPPLPRLWADREQLEPIRLRGLARATSLDLRGRGLVQITQDISRARKLVLLDVSRNALVDLPLGALRDGPGRLHRLKLVNLSHNNLTAVPPELFQLPCLRKLDLSHNRLAVLPTAAATYQRASAELYSLLLNDNRLVELPRVLGECKSLEELAVQRNPLVAIPAEVLSLPQLRRFTFHGCHFLSAAQIEWIDRGGCYMHLRPAGAADPADPRGLGPGPGAGVPAAGRLAAGPAPDPDRLPYWRMLCARAAGTPAPPGPAASRPAAGPGLTLAEVSAHFRRAAPGWMRALNWPTEGAPEARAPGAVGDPPAGRPPHPAAALPAEHVDHTVFSQDGLADDVPDFSPSVLEAATRQFAMSHGGLGLGLGLGLGVPELEEAAGGGAAGAAAAGQRLGQAIAGAIAGPGGAGPGHVNALLGLPPGGLGPGGHLPMVPISLGSLPGPGAMIAPGVPADTLVQHALAGGGIAIGTGPFGGPAAAAATGPPPPLPAPGGGPPAGAPGTAATAAAGPGPAASTGTAATMAAAIAAAAAAAAAATTTTTAAAAAATGNNPHNPNLMPTAVAIAAAAAGVGANDPNRDAAARLRQAHAHNLAVLAAAHCRTLARRTAASQRSPSLLELACRELWRQHNIWRELRQADPARAEALAARVLAATAAAAAAAATAAAATTPGASGTGRPGRPGSSRPRRWASSLWGRTRAGLLPGRAPGHRGPPLPTGSPGAWTPGRPPATGPGHANSLPPVEQISALLDLTGRQPGAILRQVSPTVVALFAGMMRCSACGGPMNHQSAMRYRMVIRASGPQNLPPDRQRDILRPMVVSYQLCQAHWPGPGDTRRFGHQQQLSLSALSIYPNTIGENERIRFLFAAPARHADRLWPEGTGLQALQG